MERLQEIVESKGLRLLGVVPLDVSADYVRFESWIGEGKHGGMEFLERYKELRREPGLMLQGARSAILFGLLYDQGDDMEATASPKVAQYARFKDYHRVLWDKGGEIARALKKELPEARFRVVADSAPVLERALAAKTGGFIGKNTCFIDPAEGSFILLGEIFTTADFPLTDREPKDSRVRDGSGGCGTCDLCQVHCPTGALAADYSIDTKKCLAYWTIEHRGTVPEAYWPHFAKYWYGCDLCQLACPYNRKVKGWRLPKELKVREMPSLDKVALMSQLEYETWFGGTSMTRARKEGLKRNALIALYASADPLLPTVLDLFQDDGDETLKATAAEIKSKAARAVRPRAEPG